MSHRDPFDHTFKVAGGRLIVVGTKEGCSSRELEESISDRTAAIAFMAHHEDTGLSLRDVVDIARKHDVPVIVDAAGELPPRFNLKRFVVEGADLVAFSGGKHICGPNDTGFLCGRKDLIKLATVQAFPYKMIGRGMKVDRTQIVGFITALRIWLEKDEEAELNEWVERANRMANALREVSGIKKVETIAPRPVLPRYHVKVTFDDHVGNKADCIVFNLRRGDPSIWLEVIDPNSIFLDMSGVRSNEEEIIVSALAKQLEEDT
jgi:L-seryl-tRNA(Ser) seleniumtransferase